MTPSNGNIFRVTGLLYREFTGHRWIPCINSQWRGALMFSLMCAWINGWVNNGKTGDLRRHRAHYDVTVMYPSPCCSSNFLNKHLCYQFPGRRSNGGFMLLHFQRGSDGQSACQLPSTDDWPICKVHTRVGWLSGLVNELLWGTGLRLPL